MPVHQRRSQPQRHSIGPRNVDVKWLNRRPQPADDFAGPKRIAQERYPAVFRLANRAKRVAVVGRLVGVHTALGKVAFERRIGGLRCRPGSNAERLSFEAFKDLPQLLLIGLRQHEAALCRLAQGNLPRFAKLSYPLDVAEKIDDVRFVSRKSREDRRPDLRRILAPQRLAVFRFEQFEAHCLKLLETENREPLRGKDAAEIWSAVFP